MTLSVTRRRISTSRHAEQLPLFDPIKIPLTGGRVATVDPIDADVIEIGKWQYVSGYAVHMLSKGKIKMHRMILSRKIGRELTRNEWVDHIDGDTLNNVRSNLRICTPQQNRFNQKTPSTNTSGFKGVLVDKRFNKTVYRAKMEINGKYISLGKYDTPEEAHEAYKAAAKRYHGEFARAE